jgi:MFS family permease
MTADAPRQPQARHDAYAAFRYPAFTVLFIGGFLIHLGAAAQGVAFGWELYVRTNSVFLLGLTGLIQAIPMLLLTLPSGYLADAYNRKNIILLGIIGTTLTSIGLGTLSLAQAPVLGMFALLFLDACFNRIAGPSASAILPLLVPPETLENAIKWRTSLFQLCSVVGPAIGGVIIAMHIPTAYFFSAACTTGFLLLLWGTTIPTGRQVARGSIRRQLYEGVAFVWNQKIILGSVSLDMFAVLLGGAVYLLPVFARDILTTRPFGLSPEQTLGWLRAAPALGAVLMAITMAHRPPLQRAGRSMLLAVAAFGVATIIFGLSRSFWLSFAMLFLTGAFDNTSVVVRHTLVQLRTPNELRGRVSAVNSMFIGTSNELGGFESGLVARFFGPVASVVSGGIGTILVVLLWTRMFPGLARLRRLHDPA